MSDAGGEYKSTQFDDVLRSMGIEVHTSSPHTHQQNGHAERFIWTMMDQSEAMRHEACIADSWWEFSIAHVVHIYNQTPKHQNNWKTPYEMIYGLTPTSITHLRVFRCAAYVFIPAET